MKNRNYLYKIILILPIFLLCGCIKKEKAPERIWTFEMEGIVLDSLKVDFRGHSNQDQEIYFDNQGNNKWIIDVPDSIYYDYIHFNLTGYQQKEGWITILLTDSPKIVKYNAANWMFFSDDKPVILQAKFDSISQNNLMIFSTNYSDVEYLNGKKMGTLLFESSYDGLSQEECIKTISKYVELYPNSIALMKELDSFKSLKTDLDTFKRIYSLFTEDVKNIPAGKSFKTYLDDREYYESNNKIRIFELINCDNQKVEPFIQDDGKYKLILFSSVGCGPCHKAIPLYKQVYNDLSDKLDIVYISIDEKYMINDWKELLEEYEIPWRSYFSYNIEGGILQKYMFTSIPSSLLVYPDLTFEKIDIRKEENKEKLNTLIKSDE